MKTLKKTLISVAQFFLVFPVGAWKMWNSNKKIWLKIVYTLTGIPFFAILFSLVIILTLGAFLKPLDLSIGDRKDRTIVNSDGNYAVTFIKTAKETDKAYELVEVEIEPGGGNGLHYHKDFEEYFTAIKGTTTIVVDGKEQKLTEGQSAVAIRKTIHCFKNDTKEKVVLQVKTTPARGLEKSLRVTYGLTNTGQWEKDGLAKNPWHLFLLLGYSGTYMPGVPPMIQEPLVNSLAKIAQWRGEDKELEVFFK